LYNDRYQTILDRAFQILHHGGVARPRSYERENVLAAAEQTFWTGGFLATGIDQLERTTGLGRSSLYLAFGSKQALFQAALTHYEDSFISPRLARVEAPGAGLKEVAAFFSGLALDFRDPASQRGCLLVNSITELAQRNAEFTPQATRLVDRYLTAFSNALRGAVARGDMDRRLLDRRTKLLASSAHGVWVIVRADHEAAAAACRAIAREITSWSTNNSGRQLKSVTRRR
jgi:TetR/AcrR family transcriptional repressor of nem operon